MNFKKQARVGGGGGGLVGSVGSKCGPVTGSQGHGVKSLGCIEDGAFLEQS